MSYDMMIGISPSDDNPDADDDKPECNCSYFCRNNSSDFEIVYEYFL